MPFMTAPNRIEDLLLGVSYNIRLRTLRRGSRQKQSESQGLMLDRLSNAEDVVVGRRDH